MAKAYYNEIDAYAAQWLRNLIKAGLIVPGDVDERSIKDVEADDIAGYDQCHFFAGIGVWSYALRLAGWPDDRPVWTGSCPCQPFSSVGSQKGTDDDRHLWPEWYRLVNERQPAVVFGEQVEAAIKHGWLDLVSSDMEKSGYAIGAAVLPAAGVGAPHIRSRTYFVALGNNTGERFGKTGLACNGQAERIANGSATHIMVHALGQRLERLSGNGDENERPDETGSITEAGNAPCRRVSSKPATASTAHESFWSDADWIFCRDNKWRPVEPGTFPLADGVTARVGRLRAYGNAIEAQTAATFIKSIM